MKKLFLGLVLTFILINTSYASDDDFCTSILEVAETVMEARQSGVGILEVLEGANKGGPIKSLLTEMVENAYSIPYYPTEKEQENVIREFGIKYYLFCIKVA